MSDKPIKGILNSRVADSGATEYKVRFAGCDKSEDAWVPEDTVAPAQVRTAHHHSTLPCAPVEHAEAMSYLGAIGAQVANFLFKRKAEKKGH
jgi:hypothetical protein